MKGAELTGQALGNSLQAALIDTMPEALVPQAPRPLRGPVAVAQRWQPNTGQSSLLLDSEGSVAHAARPVKHSEEPLDLRDSLSLLVTFHEMRSDGSQTSECQQQNPCQRIK